MSTFPIREADIARLAQDLATGLATHQEAFPAPPVAAEEIQQSLVEYNAAREAAIQASAHAQQGTAAKNEALTALADKVKMNLRYAENITRSDNGKLHLLGWGAPRRGTANEVPGQARTLEVIREGADWVFLDWKEPADGGQVGAYKIQRRKRDSGDWIDVGMAMESEVMLNNQEPGVEWEYHVIAVNKAGEVGRVISCAWFSNDGRDVRSQPVSSIPRKSGDYRGAEGVTVGRTGQRLRVRFPSAVSIRPYGWKRHARAIIAEGVLCTIQFYPYQVVDL